ncbi:MAG: GNAT superfamily N-acetyltransferase [Paraglaciecola sp.]|jgi:GNAT superfamily N-acetyltransferase
MKLELNDTPQGIASCFAVMSLLRSTFTQQQFVQQVLVQQRQGYQLLSASQGDEIPGVAGFVIASKLAWGKHLYVDDLVTAQGSRSRGIGRHILMWLTDYAVKQQCIQLHLDSGVQRFDAHKFYLREGFHISSHHFALDLPNLLS